MTEKICDISAWQGEISVANFTKAKKSGITGVILRSSYTSQKSFSLHEDKVFRNNIVNAHKAGLKIGIYHYSQAINASEARAEAEFTANVIERYKSYINLPVFFDTEFGKRLNSSVAKKLGKTGYGKVCDAYCDHIKGKGYRTGVYANLSTLNTYLPATLYKEWSIWLAQYSRKNDYKYPVIAWQYTSSGSVPGISGKVDMNYWYGATPPPTPQKYKGTFPIIPRRGYFMKGDKGEQVKNLQRLLLWLGYSVGRYGVDGEYGRNTASAVYAYELDYKLRYKDGEWGKECQEKAKTIML